jgi:transcriptional regulator with XRE-family HTH domain
MAHTDTLIETLKQALKANGLTYADIARSLNWSEASVKRWFANGNMTVQRLEAICELIGMEMIDLVRMLDENRHRVSHLTLEQEKELVADTRLLLVALCVNGHWRFEDIIRHYDIPETKCIHLLAHLDKLKLIELLPNNRIRLLVAQDFCWLPNGPIERFFEQQVQDEFLHAGFHGNSDLRMYLNGSLSASSIELMQRTLKGLAAEFNELRNADAALPLEERQIMGMVLAIRHWELSIFRSLRRKDTATVVSIR